MSNLKNKIILITGSTRGIGRSMALRFAQDGACIVVTGKTEKENGTLPGTIYSVAEEVEKAGGKALPLLLDARDDKQIEQIVAETVKQFGGIDILVNNASAIALTNTLDTVLKRFDLMMSVNARATFACSRACIPHLKKAKNPHILNMSPPLHMDSKWFQNHLAYTYSKYGMSMCTLGMSAEFQQDGIAVNSLWPRTTIATMAIKVHFPPELYAASRDPAIVANAAYWIVTQNSRRYTGQFFIDEVVLTKAGESDFNKYNITKGTTPMTDLFLS